MFLALWKFYKDPDFRFHFSEALICPSISNMQQSCQYNWLFIAFEFGKSDSDKTNDLFFASQWICCFKTADFVEKNLGLALPLAYMCWVFVLTVGIVGLDKMPSCNWCSCWITIKNTLLRYGNGSIEITFCITLRGVLS